MLKRKSSEVSQDGGTGRRGQRMLGQASAARSERMAKTTLGLLGSLCTIILYILSFCAFPPHLQIRMKTANGDQRLGTEMARKYRKRKLSVNRGQDQVCSQVRSNRAPGTERELRRRWAAQQHPLSQEQSQLQQTVKCNLTQQRS